MIFERDAMEWFERALTHPMFLRSNVWAIAGESRFFDSYRHSPSDTDVARALEAARSYNLIDKFVYLDFLPSSCFAAPVISGLNLVNEGNDKGGPGSGRSLSGGRKSLFLASHSEVP